MWGTAKSHSDFDFFTGLEGEELFKDYGFFLLQTPGLDINTINIYRKAHVDVAVLINPLWRLQVEAQLRTDPRLFGMLKQASTTEAQKVLWNFFYKTFVYNKEGFKNPNEDL